MSYLAEVTLDAPVAWWRFSETSGTTAADSGNPYAEETLPGLPTPQVGMLDPFEDELFTASTRAANGTYTGGYTLGFLGIDDPGKSVKLDGTSGYVTIGALPSKLQFVRGTNFSVEAWVYIPSGLSTPGAAVVSEAFAGDNTVRYMLGFFDGSNPGLKPSFGWYNGAWRLVQASSNLSTEAWHHLVGTYDGGINQFELWVDKVSAGTLTPGGIQPIGTETLYIGKRWDGNAGQFFNGFLDEVAMYSTKLSSTRIAAHYDAATFGTSHSTTTITSVPVQVSAAADLDRHGVSSVPVQVSAAADIPVHRFSSMVVQVSAKVLAKSGWTWGRGNVPGWTILSAGRPLRGQ